MSRVSVVSVLVAVVSVTGAEGSLPFTLPRPKDVFTIAFAPYPNPAVSPYFTSASLLDALPSFKPFQPRHKVGDRRVCQAGVIVLKSSEVIFISSCYPREIIVTTRDGGHHDFAVDGKGTDAD